MYFYLHFTYFNLANQLVFDKHYFLSVEPRVMLLGPFVKSIKLKNVNFGECLSFSHH